MSYYQGLVLFGLGYAACYVKEHKEYVFSRSIDLYVDGKNIAARFYQPIKTMVEQPRQVSGSSFWDSLTTTKAGQSYLTLYKKDDHYFKVIHDSPNPEISTNKRIADLEVVSIESESELNRTEKQLVKLILSQWSGYSGDFHGNEVKLYEIVELSDIILAKKITKIVVNTNLMTETVLT